MNRNNKLFIKELWKSTFDLVPQAVSGESLAALMVAVATYILSKQVLILWLLIVLVIAITRIFITKYLINNNYKCTVSELQLIYYAGHIPAACCWAFLGYYYTQSNNQVTFVIATFLLGVSAGASIFNAHIKYAYPIYILITLTPFIYVNFLNNSYSATVGLGCILFIFIMIKATNYYHKSICDRMELLQENFNLVKSLKFQNQSIENLNGRLEFEVRQKNVIESILLQKHENQEKEILKSNVNRDIIKDINKTLLDSIDIGVLIINESGDVKAYNGKFLEIWSITRVNMAKSSGHGIFQYIMKELIDGDDFKLYFPFAPRISDVCYDGYVVTKSKKRIYFKTVKNNHLANQNLNIWIFNDVTHEHQARQALTHQATHDFLTNLPNRVLIYDRLKGAIQRAERSYLLIAVLFIDVDDFKMVNDSFGHEYGDCLIKLLGVRLSGCVRQTDSVGRYSGDEFIIILEGLTYKSDADNLVMEIKRVIEAPYILKDVSVNITLSIGVCFYPIDACSFEEVIKFSDISMYQSKQSGKGRVISYSQNYHQDVIAHHKMYQNLKQAVKENQLFLEFQPIFCFKKKQVVGVEALLRWSHNSILISPSEFIAIAEKRDLISEIGYWVLKKSICYLNTWNLKDKENFFISVNVSPKQLISGDFFNNLMSLLDMNNISPQQITLEITEGESINNAKAVDMIHRLRGSGFEIAIDDFGMGYSNLDYLNKISFSKLKIDKSFVNENSEGKHAIAQSIIQIAKKLDVVSIVEGIEKKEQYEFFDKIGCTYMQGYYFSKPLKNDELLALLARQDMLIGKH